MLIDCSLLSMVYHASILSSDYIHSQETYWRPFWEKCWIHMWCDRRLGERWNHACEE